MRGKGELYLPVSGGCGIAAFFIIIGLYYQPESILDHTYLQWASA